MNRERVRHWAGEAWYYGRLWVLGLAAVMIVCWMVSAILLANFPHLAGTVYGPKVERSQDHTIEQLDPRAQEERWGRPGSPNPQGESPMEDWKHHRPLVEQTMERHQRRGRLATAPTPPVSPLTSVSAGASPAR